MMLLIADMAAANVGFPKILTSLIHGPSRGAREGRDWTPTATVRVRTAETMQNRPNHPNHEILPSVRIEAIEKPAIAATPMKTAVHVACVETALRAVDKPTSADAAVKTITEAEAAFSSGYHANGVDRLTKAVRDIDELLADAASPNPCSVRKTVDVRVLELEGADGGRTVWEE